MFYIWLDIMYEAYLIAGLPASGKTTYAKNFKCKLFDDPKDLKEIIDYCKCGNNIIITDPNFCITEVRNKAQKILLDLGYKVNWIFFENNPNQCIINSKKRPEKSVEMYIKQLSLLYNIPENSVILSVWK